MPLIMKILTVLGFVFLCHALHAQSIESSLNKPTVNCADIYKNSVPLMNTLYEQQAFDSIQYGLQYMKDKCGMRTETFALQLLLDMQLNQFAIGSPLNSETLGWLQSLANEMSNPFLSSSNAYYQGNSGHLPLVKKWAIALKRTFPPDATQAFLCSVLSGEVKQVNSAIVRQRQQLPDLYQLVQEGNEYYRKQPNMIFGVQVGAWRATGNAAILGTHPTMGMLLGGSQGKNQLLFNMNFRFVNNEKTFNVVRNGITYPTNYFFGGYIGLDYTRFLVQQYKHHFGLGIGAGYDGFDVFNESNEMREALKPVSINSFNANIGLKYHYYFNTNTSVSLLAKYNLVNYRNPGGTSLRGNTFSVDLAFNIHSISGRSRP